jgi:2-phosphosulfolactate phosphatase
MVQLLTTDGDVMTDSARGALLMYNEAKDNLVEVAAKSRNGKRLYDINLMADVEYCFYIDTLTIVPQYREGRIVVDK